MGRTEPIEGMERTGQLTMDEADEVDELDELDAE
jgi:hypothetical protein